jgi:oxygen-independent coproporphyrinogen-3 oxidase
MDSLCLPVTAADGAELCLHRLGPPVGCPVLLVPGLFSNHTFYLGTRRIGLARHLAAEGFACTVLDPRGHGQSARPAPDQHWTFEDWGLYDVPRALAEVSSSQKTFVVGHSAGGAAVLCALAAHPELRSRVAGLVLLAAPAPRLGPARRVLAALARALSRARGYFPARALALGPEDEPGPVMEQWMGWNLSGRWQGRSGVDYLSRLGEIDLPLLAMAGGGDRLWAPPEACQDLADRLASEDWTFVVAGRRDGYSADLGHPGLVVSPLARREVWPALSGWLRERNSAARSVVGELA